jgi:D-isomer specific 2-hydroxyacid dehydrogenase-like protein
VCRPIAFVAALWPEPGLEALRSLGYEVRRAGTSHPDALVAQASTASVLIVGTEPVDDALLDRLPSVEIVCATGPSLSTVDVDACTRRRIPVLYAPDTARIEATCADLARLGDGQQPQHCVNPGGVLPITPPAYFVEMRRSDEFHEGALSRELAQP